MKTQQEIEDIMKGIQKKIGLLNDEMFDLNFTDEKYRNLILTRIRLTDQYNILLDILL